MSKVHGVAIKNFILVGHSAGGHIALLYAYKYLKDTIKIAACVSLAGPTDFTDDSGWSSMTMWGEDMEKRLSFLSQIGSRLTGHTIEIKQHNWTKQNNYCDFNKHIVEISPIYYVSNNTGIPPTLLVHARCDNQVPYSNAIRLKQKLDNASIPNKLITPTGNANNHMLGGEVTMAKNPIVFKNIPWVNEAKKWIEGYLD
jgi:acetyl esterase/lipase